MILIVNFNLVENALLEKVSTELGFAERCQYIEDAVTTPQELSAAFKRSDSALPRVIIINLDSFGADWKTLLGNLKADEIWRFIRYSDLGSLKATRTWRSSTSWAAHPASANRTDMKDFLRLPKPPWAIGSMCPFYPATL